MRDLSKSFPLRLVPTSQEGGNMSFDNSPAMTAPGSVPVTPLPQYMDEPYGVPEPGAVPSGPAPAAHLPVGTQKQPSTSRPAGGGAWRDTGDQLENTPSPGWKRV